MGNYNDHLMEQLADQGDGFYRYVDTYEEAQAPLRRRAHQRCSRPVADDARTQVQFDPELVSSYRLVGYENRAMDDDSFDDLSADAGELGAGHHASALYEVWLAPGVAPGTQIGTAQVLWKTPEHERPRHRQRRGARRRSRERRCRTPSRWRRPSPTSPRSPRATARTYEPPASAYDVQARAAELRVRAASRARPSWRSCAQRLAMLG